MIYILILVLSACSVYAQTDVFRSQREGEKHRKEAERFFEDLHVVPPGMNWRVVNDAVRTARVARVDENVQLLPVVGDLGKWREVGSANQAGRVVAVEYDDATGRVWLAGAGGTLWSGDTTGTSWTCLSDARSIESPISLTYVRGTNGTEHLIVVSSSSHIRTFDLADNSWTDARGLEELQRWGGFSNAVTCERGGRLEIYAVGQEWDFSAAWTARSVVYRSIDSGVSFVRLRWFNGLRQIWTDRTSSVWLIHGDTLSSIAANGALTQISRPLPMIANDVYRVVLAGTSLSNVVIGVVSSDTTVLHRSRDKGLTWTETARIPFSPFSDRSFAQSYEDGRWLIGGVNVLTSAADGTAWELVNEWGAYYGDIVNKLHADIPVIKSFPRAERGVTFIATDGGLYISRNGGRTVRNISLQSLNISQYYSSYTSRDNVGVVSAGSQDQGFQRSRLDSGGVRSFQQMISGDYSSLASGDGGHSLFGVYPGFTMVIPDHEDGWEPRFNEFTHRNHLWLPPLAVGTSHPDQAWLGGGTLSNTGAFVFLYTFEMGALNVASLPFDFGEGDADVRITALAFAPSDDDYCYVVTSAGLVWTSTDHGGSWKRRLRPDMLTGHYFSGNALCIDPKNPLRLFLGGSGYDGAAVYSSTDGGYTFRAMGGLPPCLVLSLASSEDGRYIAAATDAGAFLYDATTKKWSDITELGSPDQTYWHVDRIEPLGIFRFSTYGRGLWDFALAGPVGVDDGIAQEEAAPTMRGVLLGDRSVIDIDAPEDLACTLSWYDLEGRNLFTERRTLSTGTTRLERPQINSIHHGPLTCIIVTARGYVAAAVAP